MFAVLNENRVIGNTQKQDKAPLICPKTWAELGKNLLRPSLHLLFFLIRIVIKAHTVQQSMHE